ncbi:unnamed protein product (macronuclear) [Paramecium tetraurelia]|uniref:Protein kinase domain-containing protein n=1 Tax=Paramecium tetraurelia TaxID=5888 RepID=A0CHZ0_PARTE|nr:uncharacterized protein GSPATT00038509001 [Paramecium tetraurelia]CAK70407.1 unnamed protein product [Paramecium tetraurelia]|eukprot:XP_001437804.1 hypothetical protein (macronuclear) [Paramecium tetraurelia strain d4-2]
MISSNQQGKILFIQGRGYEIIREIQQQGAQSINYIAKCIGNPYEQVIIKQYNQIKVDELQVLNIIQKEQIDDKSKNKHIIKILGIQDCSQQEEQKNFLMVMEQGKNNLQHLINTNKSFNLAQKLKLFRQMIKGVKELHALGYSHRDLKPENFVYFENQRKNYTVKLIDFGLVKKDSTRLKSLQVGTCNYMSPEVMIGEGNYDKTVDIWSLGIILYQMLTTEYLIKAKNTKDLMFQMLAFTQDYIDLTIDQTNCMGQQEKEIIKSMLQKESQHRCNLDIILNKIDELLKEIKEQEQKEIQQFKDQKQQCIVQLKDIKSTISNVIQYLIDTQQIIKQINLQNNTKQQLFTYINNEIQKYEEILLKNEQQLKSILYAQTKEMLKEYHNINYLKTIHHLLILKEKNKLEQQLKDQVKFELFEEKQKIEREYQMKMEQEQKLKKEKEKEQYQFSLQMVKQQLNQQSPQIQLIQDQIHFYQIIEIQGNEKISDVIKYHQQITQDIQTVEFQEKIIEQYESLQQQIATYQSCNSKLEEIQEAQNRNKTQIEEAIKSTQQKDQQYLVKNQQQMEELYKELIDYQEKYQYLSKNQKYSNQITCVITQIGQAFSDLDKLKQLIFQRTLPAYQEYSQINQQIQKSLVFFEKQHSQLHQQIYNDELIALKIQERIKKLEIAKDQFGKFIIKMNKLKDQVKDFIKNEYCNNYDSQKLIDSRIINIDQNVKEQQELFELFAQLIQSDSCENINNQITQLEEFQRKLKEVEINEIEYINQLEQIIKKEMEDKKSEKEKKILNLNNKLQTRYGEYTKALQSIKFQFQSVEFYQQMNQKKENLQKELEQEIRILNQYSLIYQENMKLLEYEIKVNQKKRGMLQQNIEHMLKIFQQTCHHKGQKLYQIIYIVSHNYQQLNFCLMDDNLIKNYGLLKIQEEQLKIKLISINQNISNQQLNPQQLDNLIEYIITVFSSIDELMDKIPNFNQINDFNKAYQQNLESYEKVYALINYIRQYHLTRYYERIKVNTNQQKKIQQNNKESDYQKIFQSKLICDQEDNTKKEKEALDILLRYENVICKNYYKMNIEVMEKDKKQIEKMTVEIENLIKQKNLVKLRSKLKDQNKIKEIIGQYYKITEFTQMLIFKIAMSSINENAQY